MLTHSLCVKMNLSIWFVTPWPPLPIHQHAMDSCSQGIQALQLVPDPPCCCQVFPLSALDIGTQKIYTSFQTLTRCPAQSIALISSAELFYRYDRNVDDKIRAQTQFHVALGTLPFCCSGRGRQIQEYQQLCYSLLSQEVIPLPLYHHNVHHSKSVGMNLFFFLLYL